MARGRLRLALTLSALAACALAALAFAATRRDNDTVSPAKRIVVSGRRLAPPGKLVRLGGYPDGAAVTADGRFWWTVSSGWARNDVRIVSTRTGRVIQVLPLPGGSGGVALDSRRRRAYVSGVPDTDNSDIQRPRGTPGENGDVVHVFTWSRRTGRARFNRVIAVPPPEDAPRTQTRPPSTGYRIGWPGRLAVSAGGGRLLVPLALADRAAVVDTRTDRVRYVPIGSHPYGAAILPGGHVGLVSNEAPGTVSVIDLDTATKVKDIQVGAHLSHPETIRLDPRAARAYVPLANSDQVVVIDTRRMGVERTLSVERAEGFGAAPVDTAVSADGRLLLVAESRGNELAVFRLPGRGVRNPWQLIGRIPTADYTAAVDAVGRRAGVRCRLERRARRGRRRTRACPKLLWVASRGFGTGPNPGGPAPGFDIPTRQSIKGLITGTGGIVDVPSAAALWKLTRAATSQLHPANAEAPPKDTPLRPHGPIKHVFYLIRENRTYDQVLGDDARGDGAPAYSIFGQRVTPNLHALVRRFPLLDRLYANSEASIDGHFWTAAGNVPDYVDKNWRQNYAGRRRPDEFGGFVISYPPKGFLVDQAERQKISWYDLGEAVSGINILPGDRDRTQQDLRGNQRRYSRTDIGYVTGGCYDPYIGKDELLASVLGADIRIYDSSKPAGAAPLSISRFDCFKLKFRLWQLTNSTPTFVYITMPNDHTNGASPKHHTPRAMVADNDLGTGQLVDLISHSKIWKQSAIFVVEDDSQDGTDHQDAHRIPAAVISPYAKRGAVVHTRYDFLSVIRSMELIMGMRPLGMLDALATPMYDAFTPRPDNAAPFDAVPATYPILEENPRSGRSEASDISRRYDLTKPDQISQRLLDRVLWKTVKGPRAEPPPPGPNAEPGG